MKSRLPLVLCLLLAACAITPENQESRFTGIATTPLSDLNLVRAKIPPVLRAAREQPYAPPTDSSCAGLAADIRVLDTLLGPDLDAPPNGEQPGPVAQSVEFVGDAAVGAVRNAAEGIIPFRSWIRKLTGAERHAREVSASIKAGNLRRAYLKGLGQAAGCPPPAAPCPIQKGTVESPQPSVPPVD